MHTCRMATRCDPRRTQTANTTNTENNTNSNGNMTEASDSEKGYVSAESSSGYATGEARSASPEKKRKSRQRDRGEGSVQAMKYSGGAWRRAEAANPRHPTAIGLTDSPFRPLDPVYTPMASPSPLPTPNIDKHATLALGIETEATKNGSQDTASSGSSRPPADAETLTPKQETRLQNLIAETINHELRIRFDYERHQIRAEIITILMPDLVAFIDRAAEEKLGKILDNAVAGETRDARISALLGRIQDLPDADLKAIFGHKDVMEGLLRRILVLLEEGSGADVESDDDISDISDESDHPHDGVKAAKLGESWVVI
ncbi:hypothetical protein F5Y16DRAFT_396866 [Xylariaceae sp. FL0255]|nr:hypothetical protein F5Y16DRAFT_396866 [Xylariaceae sp. FL0255]